MYKIVNISQMCKQRKDTKKKSLIKIRLARIAFPWKHNSFLVLFIQRNKKQIKNKNAYFKPY